MSLESVRARFDALDAELARLLSARMRLSDETAREKKRTGGSVYAPAREQAVLARVSEAAGDPYAPSVREVYALLFSLSRAAQRARISKEDALFMPPEALCAPTADALPAGAAVACSAQCENARSLCGRLLPGSDARLYPTEGDALRAVSRGECSLCLVTDGPAHASLCCRTHGLYLASALCGGEDAFLLSRLARVPQGACPFVLVFPLAEEGALSGAVSCVCQSSVPLRHLQTLPQQDGTLLCLMTLHADLRRADVRDLLRSLSFRTEGLAFLGAYDER